MKLLLQEYEGKQLTIPEIEYMKCIYGERNRVKQDHMEKAFERQLLSQISIAQEAGKKSQKPTEVESLSNHSYVIQQQQLQNEEQDEDSETTVPILKPKKPLMNKQTLESTKHLVLQAAEEEQQEVEEHPTGEVSSFKPIRKRKLVEEKEEPEVEFLASEGFIHSSSWCSKVAESNLSLLLPNFGVDSHNNTIGVLAKVERPSRGWAFNISPADDKYSMDVLFHFNPRYGKNNKIIMNDRVGTWGTSTDISMRDQNQQGILATEIQLKIQIREEGFVVFANDLFCAFFAHRRRYDRYNDLRIVILVQDDNGRREEVTIEKIWWGRQDFRRHTLSPNIMSLMKKIASEKPETVLNPLEPRTIVLEGLPLMDDLEMLQGLEYALMDLLEACKPEKISLVTGQGIAYIRMRKPEDVQPTIEVCKQESIQGPDGDILLNNVRPLIQTTGA